MNSMVGSSLAEAPVAYSFCPLTLPISSYHCIYYQKRALLRVENLSPRVPEYITEIFAVAGQVQHLQIIIPDRRSGLINNYGFVEYKDMRAAETAVQVLNGRKIFDTEIRVKRAYQGQQNLNKNTSDHSGFQVFIGNLGREVNDTILAQAFEAFGSLSDACVMWNMNTGKSRGYGFVTFRDKANAEQAIAVMNGEWLGSRAISVTWADQRTQGGPSESTGSPTCGGGTVPAPQAVNFLGTLAPLSYKKVVGQTDPDNTTVYLANLTPYCTKADLIPLFQSVGYISEIRMHADRGYHEHFVWDSEAQLAMCQRPASPTPSYT
jgi:nucleolysin TIA-1/TIAR